MRKKPFLALFVIGMVGMLLSGCANTTATQTAGTTPAAYQKITAAQAHEMMREADGWLLLDVRTDEEFSEGHIAGARLIPDDEIAGRAESELPDKDATILIYCRSGRRSANSARELLDMGYTNVYDFGGIIDWPYDIVSGES